MTVIDRRQNPETDMVITVRQGQKSSENTVLIAEDLAENQKCEHAILENRKSGTEASELGFDDGEKCFLRMNAGWNEQSPPGEFFEVCERD